MAKRGTIYDFPPLPQAIFSCASKDVVILLLWAEVSTLGGEVSHLSSH